MSPDPISVCIATYRRPARLLQLLADLQRQSLPPAQVVIVDNDPVGSARDAVREFARTGTLSLRYDVEPHRGIALARNRTVALADGDWLAFVDDDERAPSDWLQLAMAAASRYHADGILGPVVPEVPRSVPPWLLRGRFYDFARFDSGTIVPPNRLRLGNALLRAALVHQEPGPFDPRYGLATGEDGDLLLRLVARGGRLVWCDEAAVYEPIEPARLSLTWLLQRAYSRGQEFGHKRLAGRYGPMTLPRRIGFAAECSGKLLAATALSVLDLPRGRHRSGHWLVRSAANIGKLTALIGGRYEEYEKASASKIPD
jgi:succinoglycan biosynthesis protein ExoM